MRENGLRPGELITVRVGDKNLKPDPKEELKLHY